MTKEGHRAVGYIGAGALFALGHWPAAAGFILGCQAPDSWEFSFRKPGMKGDKPWHYGRLIPHRTLTHWPFIWLLMLVTVWLHLPVWLSQFSLSAIMTASLTGLLTGYLLSALFHLLMDWGTPMGIPIWWPFGRRYSLRLYSKHTEFWMVMTVMTTTAAGLVIHFQLSGSPPLLSLAQSLRQWLIV